MTSGTDQPKHVQRFKDRHGRERLYFRRAGFPKAPLPSPVGSPAFMRAYLAALESGPAPEGERTARQTAGASAPPRRAHSIILPEPGVSRARSQHAPRLSEPDRAAASKARASCGGRNEARARDEAARRESGDAQRREQPSEAAPATDDARHRPGWRADDPTAGIKMYRTGAEGLHSWDEGEIARFLEIHRPGNQPAGR